MTSALTDAAVVVAADRKVRTVGDPEIIVESHRLMRALVVLGLIAAVLLTTLAMLTARQSPSSPASVGSAGVARLQPVQP